MIPGIAPVDGTSSVKLLFGHHFRCRRATIRPDVPLVQRVQCLSQLENGSRSVRRRLGLALRFAKQVHRTTGSKTKTRDRRKFPVACSLNRASYGFD